MVGTMSSRKHLRLQAGADVEAAVRAAADLPPKSGAGPSSSEQSSREAAGAEEPSTQGMDVDSDNGADEPPRPLSPVRMASFEATLCLVCASEETDGSIELACGVLLRRVCEQWAGSRGNGGQCYGRVGCSHRRPSNRVRSGRTSSLGAQNGSASQ